MTDAEPLSAEAIERLNAELDPGRVRRREGRGGGEFSYLATHDVKRTANEIFGFGNWGYRIIDQHQLATVPVRKGDGKEGTHVAWYCRVELTVRGCIPVSGSGYGDGVEYGPTAIATAQELAIKESESDALKRALTNFGDQFGLILYAKADERARIEEEPPPPRLDADDPIRDWPDLLKRFTSWGEAYDWPLILQTAATSHFNDGPTINDLPREQKGEAFLRSLEALFWLWQNSPNPDQFPPLAPEDILHAFAHAYEGLALPADVVRPLARNLEPPFTRADEAGEEGAANGSGQGEEEAAESAAEEATDAHE
jgi:Rad52/22 family double-strand break repair protein